MLHCTQTLVIQVREYWGYGRGNTGVTGMHVSPGSVCSEAFTLKLHCIPCIPCIPTSISQYSLTCITRVCVHWSIHAKVTLYSLYSLYSHVHNPSIPWPVLPGSVCTEAFTLKLHCIPCILCIPTSIIPVSPDLYYQGLCAVKHSR